jgi:hypothetical protein
MTQCRVGIRARHPGFCDMARHIRTIAHNPDNRYKPSHTNVVVPSLRSIGRQKSKTTRSAAAGTAARSGTRANVPSAAKQMLHYIPEGQ